MIVRKYINKDANTIFELYNLYAPQNNYAKLSRYDFDRLVIKNSFFDCNYTFLLCAGGTAVGFVMGVVSNDLPMGKQSGYFSCLALGENEMYEENVTMLLLALEKAFKEAGKIFCDVTYFNPIKLPWIIPYTNNHLHSNMPGIWDKTRLYSILAKMGYISKSSVNVMYMSLKNYETPKEILQKKARLKCEGYSIEKYDKTIHTGLYEMLKILGNPEWEKEINFCAQNDIPFLVAVQNCDAVGYAGPIYPEKKGRGTFIGLGVVPAHEGRGLGTVLFFELCQEQWDKGAKYISLFAEKTDPAKKIYERAGLVDVRLFLQLRKTL